MRTLIRTDEALNMVLDRLGIILTQTTIRNWCVEYGLGIKIGGRWFVDKIKLDEFLKGKSNEK